MAPPALQSNETERGSALVSGVRRASRLQDRYGLLLSLLVTSYLVSAFADGVWLAVPATLYGLSLIVALRASRMDKGRSRLIVGVLVLGSLAAVIIALSDPSDVLTGLVDFWVATILLVTVLVILRRILSNDSAIGIQAIFGALSAYLIIGLMFAQIYAGIDRVSTNPFFAGGQAGNATTFQYFSFVTLATVGYGDYTALQSFGRSVAVLEALMGQVFLVTLVAHLVSRFRPRLRGEAAIPDQEAAPEEPHRRSTAGTR